MNTNPDTTDDAMELTMGLTFHNGDTMTLQQVVHGMQPLILIKPVFEDDDPDTNRIKIDATGPSSQEELADLLDTLAQLIRASDVTSDSRDQTD